MLSRRRLGDLEVAPSIIVVGNLWRLLRLLLLLLLSGRRGCEAGRKRAEVSPSSVAGTAGTAWLLRLKVGPWLGLLGRRRRRRGSVAGERGKVKEIRRRCRDLLWALMLVFLRLAPRLLLLRRRALVEAVKV